MFTITILTVGKLKEKFYISACDEYLKRMKGYCSCNLIELPECRLPDNPSETEIAAGLAKEAEEIKNKQYETKELKVTIKVGEKPSMETMYADVEGFSKTDDGRYVIMKPVIKENGETEIITFTDHIFKIIIK